MEKLVSKKTESYFEKVEHILIPNWRNGVKSGKSLRHIINPVKLCSLKIEVLTSIIEELEAVDVAELKNQRLEWNTRYSVQKRMDEFKRLEQQCKQLLALKNKLTEEKIQLENDISFYISKLQSDPL